MKPKSEKSIELYHIMTERGYPEEFCDVITRNLNTDFTAQRMLWYLSHYEYLPEGEIVDEMLAILSDRNAIMQKKELEKTMLHGMNSYSMVLRKKTSGIVKTEQSVMTKQVLEANFASEW